MDKEDIKEQLVYFKKFATISEKAVLEDIEEYLDKQDKEIERLNNIINELEKWYKKQYEDTNKCLDYAREYHNLQDTEKYTRDHNMFAMCMEKLDKLKELKEGNTNE